MQIVKPSANYNAESKETTAPNGSSAPADIPVENEVSTKQNTLEESTPACVYSKGLFSHELKKQNGDIELERFQKMLENIRNQKKNVKQKKAKVNFNAATELIQLANSETISQATSVLSRVSLKYSNTANSDDKDVLILRGSMLKVIRKARHKIKKLKTENNLATKKKNAQAGQKEAEVKKLERELNMRKKSRKLKEQNDILEAITNNPKRSADDPYTAQLESRLSTLYAANTIEMSGTETIGSESSSSNSQGGITESAVADLSQGTTQV